MSATDFDDPVYRVNPPPEPKPAFDPTANPIWGPLFTEERQPRGYRVRPEAVWLQAKDEYLRGFSAEAVCAEFDLGLSTFRQRARREGWRRSDATEDAAPDPMDFALEPEAAPPTAELADLAWRSAAQAIRRGRVYEARAWMKLADALRAQARAEATNAAHAQTLAKRAAEEGAQVGAELHGLHGEEGVQSSHADGDDPDDDAPGDHALDDALDDGPPTEAQVLGWIANLEASPGRCGATPMIRNALKEARGLLASVRAGGSP